MLSSVLSRASLMLQQRPVATTFVFAGVRGYLGDVSAQYYEFKSDQNDNREGEFSIDYKRTTTYIIWTIGVGFVIDKYIYATKFAQWFPSHDIHGKLLFSNVMKANCLDNFILTPVFYFPLYYIFKDCVMDFNNEKTPSDALIHYSSEAYEQVTACWIYWFPLHMVTFGLVPAQLRVPFVSVGAMGYVTVLSYVTAALDKVQELKKEHEK
mmetsp:Transcript_52909/g.67848  ORF Transcript_52909/g.67848 Transcript_52909/m.67848 type:complete len:210 (-) Transcript_52909:242-871(-)